MDRHCSTSNSAADKNAPTCSDASHDGERLEQLRDEKRHLSWRIGKQKSAGRDASDLIARAAELKAEIERIEATQEEPNDELGLEANGNVDDASAPTSKAPAPPTPPPRLKGDWNSLKPGIIEEGDWAAWDEKLRASGGSVFNSSLWAHYRRDRGDEASFRIALLDGPEMVKPIALATLSTGRVSRRLRVRGGIEAETREQFAGAEQLLLEIAHHEGCVTIQVDGRDLPFEQPLTPFGFDGPQPVEIRTRCDRSVESLWQALHTDKRRNVRRARENGIEVADESSLQAASLAARFDAELGNVKSDEGEHYSGLQDDQYEALWQCLGPAGAVKFFVARFGGEPVGAAMLLTWGTRAYCWRVGYGREGRELGASPALTWARMRHACEAGFQEICLGSQHLGAENEGSPHHGLYKYKIRWDAYPVRRSSGSLVLHPVLNSLSEAANHARGWLSALTGS